MGVGAHHVQRDPAGAFGMCSYCQAYKWALEHSRADRRRWARETEDSSRVFAVGGSGSKIHTRDCHVVTRMLHDADAETERLTPADARHGGATVTWPHLLFHDEAVTAKRNRCGACSPDIPEPVRSGPVKGADGRFASGNDR